MTDSARFDVLVVGGGMTGSALALGLARQGWQVGLVEAGQLAKITETPSTVTSVDDYEPRVSAISAASKRLLDSLGVWPRLARERHCNYRGMEVWDGDGTGRIRFDAHDLQVPELGSIVENRILVRALFQALAESPVTVLDSSQVIGMTAGGEGRTLTLADGRSLTASLVVAADGGNSRLRQWAGLPTREWDYDQQAIVCTVRTARGHQHTAWQRFSPTGPLAFLPLGCEQPSDEHYCSIVWSQDTSEARRLAALDDDAFTSALESAIEGQLGAIESVSRRFTFPLRQRHAKDYVSGDVVLVGDAAHTIHPLAGQGANLGYSDVRVLLDELAQGRQRGLAPNDPLLLARYQRRRKGDNLTMMAAMEGFKQLFARDELPLRWLRNTGMRWLDRAGPLKQRLAAEAMGLHH